LLPQGSARAELVAEALREPKAEVAAVWLEALRVWRLSLRSRQRLRRQGPFPPVQPDGQNRSPSWLAVPACQDDWAAVADPISAPIPA
jgi:hypothetical protein